MNTRAIIARLAAGAALLPVLLAVLVVGVGVLAYGTGPVQDGRIEIAGLESPVTVGWPRGGPPIVEATDEAGLWTGLGYVHAADAAWAMTLWRQVALGDLASWFPQRGDLDRHARLLGFASLARQSYDALPPDDRAALDAYARGARRALSQAGVAQRDEFVLLDVRPEPWAPWHALAVERLLAWLGAPPPAADSAFAAAARTDTALGRFARADSAFRAYLGMGDFAHARAFVAPIGGAPTMAVEQPWGRSALPFYREVILRLGGRSLVAATVPGTLALPAGHADDGAWAVFPTSDLTVGPDAGPPPAPVFDRMVDRDGDETLLTIPRSSEGLVVAATPPREVPTPRRRARRPGSPADSGASRPPPAATAGAAPVPARPVARAAWRIRWPGFSRGTDLAAWRAVLRGRPAGPFVLLRGDGIVLASDGESTVLGAPVVRRAITGGVFVAGTTAAAPAGVRLGALIEDPRAARDSALAFLDDTFSPWAAGRLGPLVAALGAREDLDEALIDPYAFLLGWDARYDPEAIGASIFELWLDTHRQATGHLPSLHPDSAEAEVIRWSLRLAVTRLRARYGTAAAGWRWEAVQPGQLTFPVWAAGDARRAPARYAPLELGRGGHPTSLRAGPSLVLGGAPAVWSMWVSRASWRQTNVRRPDVETDGFLARARSVSREAATRTLRRDLRAEETLTLAPAAPAGGSAGQRSESGG